MRRRSANRLLRPTLLGDRPILNEQVVNHRIDPMRSHVDAPAQLAHRIVHNALPRVAATLECETGDGTRGKGTVAYSHGDGIGGVVDVRRDVGGEVVVPGGKGEMQPARGEEVSGRFEGDGGNPVREGKHRCESSAEGVTRQPDLSVGIHARDVVVEILESKMDLDRLRPRRGKTKQAYRCDWVVGTLRHDSILDAILSAAVSSRVTIANRRPRPIDTSTTARE